MPYNCRFPIKCNTLIRTVLALSLQNVFADDGGIKLWRAPGARAYNGCLAVALWGQTQTRSGGGGKALV